MLLRRIVLLYAVLMLCRAVFYLYNMELLGSLSWRELWPLLVGSLKFDTASVIYANGLFILLSLIPLRIRENKWYRQVLFWYYMAVNSVCVVAVNMADAVYFHYTQKRFTADEVFFAGNENSAQLVMKFMAENWYLVLLVVALSWLLALCYGRRVKEESILCRGWCYYVGGTVFFALAAGLSVAGMRGGMTRMTRPITLSNATLYTPDSGKANLILSNPFCILRTAGNGGKVKYKKFFSSEELSQLFTPEHRPALHPDSLAVEGAGVDLRGRNVAIFIMESMSAEHSAYLMPEVYDNYEIKGFTPFLDSLMRNGLCFKNMYANGGRSIQAMPSVLGSIPSFKTPFVLMPQALGASRQLPAMLRGMGYSTTFFCGSEHGSMGFGAYARSAGIDRLVSREDYEARHGKGDFDNYWGIWDEPFMQFMGEEMSTMAEPFFSTIFTLSSHHPFVVPEKYQASLPDGYTKIHKGVAYDDMAVRRFFERFGDEEWFQRTVFVFVADHVSSEKLAEVTRTYPGNMHIIGFMYTPDGALRGQIEDVVQQIDIMPTVLGLAGNTEPYFAFGRDVLNEPEMPRWSVSYDGLFRAVTRDSLLEFGDESGASTPRAGVMETDTAATLDRLRALVQQYYARIERKDYTVND